MQFPHIFSSTSRRKPPHHDRHDQLGEQPHLQEHDQPEHSTAYNNNNNKTGKTKNKRWKLVKSTSSSADRTLGESLLSEDTMPCVVTVETNKRKVRHDACVPVGSADPAGVSSLELERRGARYAVVGKLMMITKKGRRKRTAGASLSSSAPPSHYHHDDHHDESTATLATATTRRTRFSASTCTIQHSSRLFDLSTTTHAVAGTAAARVADSTHSLGGTDAAPSLLPLTSTTSTGIPSCTAPTSYHLQKHEHEELGYMQFQYSVENNDCAFQEARAKACLLRKSLLIVDACVPEGDVDAGQDIFSHPLIVEAAESLFVTLFRKSQPHQQTCGHHQKCRTRVSFQQFSTPPPSSSDADDTESTDLVPCVCGDSLTASNVVSAMIQALHASPPSASTVVVIPKYLLLLQEETAATPSTRGSCMSSSSSCSLSSVSSSSCSSQRHTKTAVFGMDDFHLAEVEFAGCDGVLATRLGRYQVDEHELQQRVVQVTYDSRRLSYCSLVRYALQRRIGQAIYYQTNDERVAATVEADRIRSSSSVRKLESSPIDDSKNKHSGHDHASKDTSAAVSCIYPDCGPKRALRKTPLQYVPLTDLQATRANRLVHYGRFDEAMHLLSPQQGLILMKAMRTSSKKEMHDMVDVPIGHAWRCVCDQVHPKHEPENQSTDNIRSNDSVSSLDDEEEDTNEWGGRCYE